MMKRRSIFQSISVMLGVAALVFWLFQGLGDPERVMMGQSGDAATLQNIRLEMNLDKPAWKRFLLYLNDISPLSYYDKNRFDELELQGVFFGQESGLCLKWPYLGKSYHFQKKVGDLIADALPGTLMLALAAMLLATIVGMSLGIIAAVRKGSIWDTSSVMVSITGISAPSFFMAIMMAWIFGFLLKDITGLSMTGSWQETDFMSGESYLKLPNLILPALTLGIRPMAIITQLTRSVMLEELNKDYIQTAYAKGLSKSRVVMTHALRNSLNPVTTAITGWLAELLGGAFFVEYIFSWKGLGKMTVDAVENLDYPLVMGAVLVSAMFFVLISLLTDLLYARLDPRIKFQYI